MGVRSRELLGRGWRIRSLSQDPTKDESVLLILRVRTTLAMALPLSWIERCRQGAVTGSLTVFYNGVVVDQKDKQ